MLRINCPWCGLRDEEEFSYGGPWDRARPENPAELSDAEWATYLFKRDNHRGVALEKWRHTYGCRQWFVCERDSVSHQVSRVLFLGEAPRPGTPQNHLSAHGSALDQKVGS
ncbi:Sarcosine oxidase subunit delta [compost metagenome]